MLLAEEFKKIADDFNFQKSTKNVSIICDELKNRASLGDYECVFNQNRNYNTFVLFDQVVIDLLTSYGFTVFVDAIRDANDSIEEINSVTVKWK